MNFISKAIGALLVVAVPQVVYAGALETRVEAGVPSLVEVYRHLHAHPELSYQEKETASFLAKELREAGYQVTEKVGDYGVEGRTSWGVVAVMENGPGPTLMLRTDLDGLPVEEKTGLPYASRARAVEQTGEEVFAMHACGHDLHMTAFLGAARLLAEMKTDWHGTLVMIGQPAEERGAGARAMLADGLFERFPRPDAAIALHTAANLESGKVGLISGYALANVDSVDILVRGRGGHGAFPHTTKDPVTLAAQIVTNLQTIVSRRVSPFDPAVITVGSIHGGSKHNIIPDAVEMLLTVRSYKPEVRRTLLDGIRATAEETALAAGFPEELAPVVTIREEEFTPATYNDPELTERLAAVFERELGADRVVGVDPVMGGEDFSRFGLEREIPITMFWLGAVAPEKIRAAEASGEPLPSLHSSGFGPDAEPAIRTGVTALTAAALEVLGR